MVNSFGQIGSQPEVIEATIQGGIARKEKSLRPLKSRLKEVNKEIRRIKAKLDDKLALAKRKDAEALSDVMLAEANELAKARKSAEDEREHLKNEIELVQRATNHENLVAEALCNFEDAYEHASFERRISLISQLLNEIRVSRIEPKNLAEELPQGTFETQIRTSWYKLKFDLHNLLIQKAFQK